MYDLPIVGYRVVSMDHALLGTVARVGPGKFCVESDGSLRWLSETAVFTVAEQRVTLVCTHHRVGEYVVAGDEESSP